MVFGFGDIIFPALPPPTMANNIAGLLKPDLWAIAKAIGDTVITETSTKTPTIVKTIVAIAKAIRALDSPIFATIVSAILAAAPDSIKTPASTPAVSILRIAGIIFLAPSIIKLTVPVSPAPPTSPPIKAPSISPYAGWTFFMIRVIAITNAITAPKAVTVTFTINSSFLLNSFIIIYIDDFHCISFHIQNHYLILLK